MDGMRCFLSEENIIIHKRELERARARLSIYEKSLPEIVGKDIRRVQSMRIDADYKREILVLKRYIMLHEVYFSSFSDKTVSPREIKKYYPSRESLIFECMEEARRHGHGFLCFFKTCGAPKIALLDESSPTLHTPPTLAVEISEHAYFLDYAFERDRYFTASLERLRFDILFD
jgi:superoxide dismutase